MSSDRKLLPHLLIPPQLHPSVWMAPGSVVIGDVHLGEDCTVWFHSVIRGDVFHIRVGKRTNIQDMSMIHVTKGRHATHIGDDVTLGHRVTLHGCTIGNRVLVGMGATIMDRAVVGDDCIIGAGALVTEGTEIPAGHLAIGSPARVKRPLTDKEKSFILTSSQNYVDYARAYREAGLDPRASTPLVFPLVTQSE